MAVQNTLQRQTQFILPFIVHWHNRQPTWLEMSITEQKAGSWLRVSLPRRPEARRQRHNVESSRGRKRFDFEKRQRDGSDGQGSGGWLWGFGDKLRNDLVPANLTATVVEKGCWNWWPKAIREADPWHFTTACLCSLISLELSSRDIGYNLLRPSSFPSSLQIPVYSHLRIHPTVAINLPRTVPKCSETNNLPNLQYISLEPDDSKVE